MTEQTAVAAPVPAKILPHTLKTLEFARQGYVVQADATMTPESILWGSSYAHVARKLRVGDHLEVLSYDGKWWAEVLVRSARDGEVQVGLLQLVEFGELESRNLSAYHIEGVGSPPKWRVRRKEDNRVLFEGADSRDEAVAWLTKDERKAA